MLSEVFSHGLIRDFVVAFGTLFNNIKINRRASSGEDSDTIAIPLSYAPQQRYIERITQDLNLDRPVAISLPRMSFEMVSMNYAPDRKLNTIQRYYGRKTDTSNTQVSTTYSPVPYDFNFQLSVYISNIEDGTHIIEQILPYFTPEFTVSLKSVTELGVNMDIPLVLNSVNMEDSYEGGYDERRIIIWTLDFTMKGHLFGPVTNYGGIVNKIKINMHPTTNTAVANNYEQIYITPAQFANGLATNTAAVSIDPTLIAANSDYGISKQIFDINANTYTYKQWSFNHSVIETESTSGNVAYNGWETYPANPDKGEVSLSHPGDFLKHTFIKTVSDSSSYDENLYLQNFSNMSTGFEQFYGKNYQNVSMRFRVKDSDGTGGSTFNWRGILKWTTTDSNEQEFSSSGSERHKDASSNPYAGVNNLDTLSQEFKTVSWDLKGESDWNNRIITALRIELFNVSDNDSSLRVDTDIDEIKIYANTSE